MLELRKVMKGLTFETENQLLNYVYTFKLGREPRPSDMRDFAKIKVQTEVPPIKGMSKIDFEDYMLYYKRTFVCVIAKRGGIVGKPFYKADFSLLKITK